MTEMRFEAVGAAAELLQRFRRDTGEWDLPRSSEFWEAIKLAHARGVRGAGRAVAIIDGAFDLSIPMLQQRVRTRSLTAPAGERTEHGTAVALLIATVAPDVVLDLYEVGRGGVPDLAEVVKAISIAASTDAHVISLSLGRQADNSRELAAFRSFFSSQDELVGWMIERRSKWFGSDSCGLCNAAALARGAGKVVVAAAGNDEEAILCPARSEAVVSCGFRRVSRRVVQVEGGGSTEVAEGAKTTYSQSADTDLTVLQPEGVLGSSFATPLVAGFAALSDDGLGLHSHLSHINVSALADLLLAGQPARDWRNIDALYREAFARHPHAHDPASLGAPCLECGVICEALYTNAGYFYMNSQDFDAAGQLLRVAHWMAPWSPHAAANLGRTLQETARLTKDRAAAKGLLQEALELYDDALRLHPHFDTYERQRSIIAGLIREQEDRP